MKSSSTATLFVICALAFGLSLIAYWSPDEKAFGLDRAWIIGLWAFGLLAFWIERLSEKIDYIIRILSEIRGPR